MTERFIETLMYASRWILAPIYLGLSLALLALGIKFFEEIYHLVPILFTMTDSHLILVILSLIDMALVGGLLIMVMFSGYENFVSKIDVVEAGEKEKLAWLGTMDAGSLKSKVAASIVAISSIQLLRLFMSNSAEVSDQRMVIYIGVHLTFVASAFTMGYLDKVVKKHHQSA